MNFVTFLPLHFITPNKDEELILKELTSESCVFDYILGRCHRSFKNIKAHVSGCIDTFKLVAMIKKHQCIIADYMDLKMILKSECQKKIIFFLHYDIVLQKYTLILYLLTFSIV